MNVNQKAPSESKLFVGWGEVEVVAINPTKEEAIQLLEIAPEYQADFKEPAYIGEKEGVKTARIAIYVKSKKTGKINSVNFFLEDKARMNKDGNKNQYINCHGLTSWADVPENLKSFFANFEKTLDWKYPDGSVGKAYKNGAKPNSTEIVGKKLVREALVGEEELYNFIRNWLVAVDYRDETTNLLLDESRFFKGDFKEIQKLVGSGLVGTVIVPYTVKIREVDGEQKEIQTINNKFSISGTQARFLRNYNLDISKLRTIKDKALEKKKLNTVEKFFEETMNDEYGIRYPEFFIPYEVQEYDPSMNTSAASTQAVLAPDDTDY